MTDNSLGFSKTDVPGADNRHYSRYPIIADLDLGEDNGGIVVDLSEGGLRIQASRELTADSLLDLRFQPWELNTWLEAKGRIVWTTKTKKFAGVEFISLPEQTRQVLRGFLGKQTNDRASHGTGTSATVRPVFPAESRAKGAAARPNVSNASTALPKFEIREIEKGTRAFILGGGSAEAVDRPTSWKMIALIVLFCLIAPAGVWLTWSGNLSSSLRGFQRLISEKHGTTQTIATANVSPAPSSMAISQVSAPTPKSIDSNLPAPDSFPPARDLGTVLQVAAMSREENATALVQSLKEQNFPAFALRQGTDPLYKVTVGPYADRRSIDAAKEELAAHGIEFFEKRWLP